MITGKTKIIGVVGNPIEHSLSPPMHNNAYKQMNMDYVYVAFSVDNIEKLIESAKTLNIIGLNITIPYKTQVIEYLDEIDETAKQINAVNTITFKNGIAKGYNTDGTGAVKSILKYTSLKDKNVLVIGAGGASKAITFTLLNQEIKELNIANRSIENAQKLKDNLIKQTGYENINCHRIKDVESIIEDMDIIINTTPIGMYPNTDVNPPIITDKISQKHTVMDIIYNPMETTLLKQAKENGATVIPGTHMLINQAVTAFELFTDKEPSYESLEEALLEQLMQ
ncbi:MAG: shikimate dehydrogenase [Methanosphaera stadtmanae]|jgi:shikimate dehydrogenase|nr:shikimate dehydrogenase [Methanosphaera stadtmanae]